jgi:hypothetical protein
MGDWIYTHQWVPYSSGLLFKAETGVGFPVGAQEPFCVDIERFLSSISFDRRGKLEEMNIDIGNSSVFSIYF